MVKISAGSYDLNKWLHGGYESDIVSVIYGDSGSGKTNFCLLTAVSQAKKGNKVIYIDTEGGFSSERIKQLAFEEYDDVLKNILLLKPTNFNEQKQAFDKILEYLKKEVSLIIVDGMTILYRLDFAEARGKNESEMRKILEEMQIPAGYFFQLIRVAISGKLVTPPMFESIKILGEEEILKRIRKAVSFIS